MLGKNKSKVNKDISDLFFEFNKLDGSVEIDAKISDHIDKFFIFKKKLKNINKNISDLFFELNKHD